MTAFNLLCDLTLDKIKHPIKTVQNDFCVITFPKRGKAKVKELFFYKLHEKFSEIFPHL